MNILLNEDRKPLHLDNERNDGKVFRAAYRRRVVGRRSILGIHTAANAYRTEDGAGDDRGDEAP